MPDGGCRRLERVDDLEPLDGAGLLLTLARRDDLLEQVGLGVEVEGLEALLDRRGAHAALEVETEAVTHLAVEDLVALEVPDLEVLEAVPDLLETLDLLVGALADAVHLALGLVADLALGVGLAPSASSSAMLRSSVWARVSTSASRRFSISFFSARSVPRARVQVGVTLLVVDGRIVGRRSR